MNQRFIPDVVAWSRLPLRLASRIAVRSRAIQAPNGVRDPTSQNRNGVRNPAIRRRETPSAVRFRGIQAPNGVRDRGIQTPTGVRDPSKSGGRPQPPLGSGACGRSPSPPSGGWRTRTPFGTPGDRGDESRSGLPVPRRVGRTEACVGSGRVGNPTAVRASPDPEPGCHSVLYVCGADPEPKLGRVLPRDPEGPRTKTAFGLRRGAGCVVGFRRRRSASVSDAR